MEESAALRPRARALPRAAKMPEELLHLRPRDAVAIVAHDDGGQRIKLVTLGVDADVMGICVERVQTSSDSACKGLARVIFSMKSG